MRFLFSKCATFILQGQAVLAALSIGDLMKAVELLYGMQCFSLCAMFIESCLQLELLELTDQTCILLLILAILMVRIFKVLCVVKASLFSGVRQSLKVVWFCGV